jgi:poly(A) polymerase Pap1
MVENLETFAVRLGSAYSPYISGGKFVYRYSCEYWILFGWFSDFFYESCLAQICHLFVSDASETIVFRLVAM